MVMVVRPEIEVLTLPSGETLIVKKRLNAGERNDLRYAVRDDKGRVDQLKIPIAMILAYIVDWTLKDKLSGEPLVIKGQSPEGITRVLRSFEDDDVREIYQAIDAHEDRMIAARAEEKKLQGGKPPSAPGSPSAVDSAFATTTSSS
jgi:hypothetical protein